MSYSRKKEKIWTQFYKFRSDELIRSWKVFVAEMMLPAKNNDPWLIQVVARLCLEKCIALQYPLASTFTSGKKHLTAGEQMVVKYSVGFVMASLRKRYNGNGNALLVSWINNQSEVSSLPTRGGLFLVNYSLYNVFHTLEIVLLTSKSWV